MTTIVLEKNQKFSESKLWEYQRHYFHKQGIKAWASQVPFYITSNPFIANSYAQVVVAYLQDLLNTNKLNTEQPVYLFELGTGSGRFSYYCLKRIIELQKQLQIDHIKICYVMTDFTENNVKYWAEHECLKPFIETGQLDFAIFNLESDKEITLINQNITMAAGSLKNPAIAFGNYIFDTITDDAFYFENGNCFELLTRLETTQDNIKNQQPVSLEKITTSFTTEKTKPNKCYDDQALNDVISDYCQSIERSSVIFPTGAFKTLNTLASWANNNLLLISTDKGYSHTDELQGLNNPKVIFHGSFSMMVNFHAMGEYMIKTGGDYFHQSIRKGIKTSVFLYGDSFENLPQTSNAMLSYVEGMGPGDFFNMHEQMKKNKDSCDLKNIVSHLRLSHWDPHVFHLFADVITKLVPKADFTTISGLLAGVPQLLKNIYMMPQAVNVYFDIGITFHAAKDYRSALVYYKQARQHYGEQFTTVFNIGLCHYSLNQLDQALVELEKAVTLDPSSESAKQWLDTVKKAINQ